MVRCVGVASDVRFIDRSRSRPLRKSAPDGKSKPSQFGERTFDRAREFIAHIRIHPCGNFAGERDGIDALRRMKQDEQDLRP